VRIQAEEFGQDTVAAVPQLDRFQACEQAALLLVQQTVEQHNGGLEFMGRNMGRNLESGGVGPQRNGEGGLSSADLIPCLPVIGGSVEEASGHLRAVSASRADQIVERILDLSMECVRQFVGEAAARGLMDEVFDGGDERAVTGEPDCIVGPQAGIVEAGGFTEGVIAPAVGITGEVVEALEFAKDGEVRGGAENVFEFRQSSDLVAQQVLAKDLGGEGEGAHNVIVPTCLGVQSELQHNWKRESG